MTSSFDDNSDARCINVDDDSGEEHVSTKKARTNPPLSAAKKRGKPPKTPSNSTVVQGGKMRKNRSPYWDHFERAKNGETATCLYCEDVVNCKSTNGTSTLSGHLKTCPKLPVNVDIKQKLLNFETSTIVNKDSSTKNVSVPTLWAYDYDRTRKSLAKMIIVDELPFLTVEKDGFKGFCKDMNPQFAVPSRFTVAKDCYRLFIEERKKLHDFFGTMSSRVCLTTDLWTSGQNLGYMCLTAHFIDRDWNLHKRVINFCQVSSHTGKVIGETIEKCLSEWNLKNVLTVTVDNASSNDVAIEYLKSNFNVSESNVMQGRFLHMRCVAHILNLVVKDGLKDLLKPVEKIRALCKYVRSSPARKKKFEACVLEQKIESKSSVCLDVETRWNSTYLMLESSLKFKKAFAVLYVKDSALQKEMGKHGGDITAEDWKQVSCLLPFLKIFYDATLKLSASLYVTSNSYVEVIYGVGRVLTAHLLHRDEGIRMMASKMKAKYDKYWGKIDNLNLFLFISLILDPRWKLVRVDWMVKKAYGDKDGERLILNIKHFFQSLFEEYSSSIPQSKGAASSSSSSHSTNTTRTSVHPEDKKQDDTFNFGALLGDEFELEMGDKDVGKKPEWEQYLDDPRESRESSFNILQWWKDNQKRYSVLAMMARDVLAIPVSSVASESAFSTGSRVLDSFRTCLSPRMVEALLCAQDWLRTSGTPLCIEDTLFDMERIEEGMGGFVLEQPEIVVDDTHDS